MKHLEEGTIHAWLDGALSDAEASDVSQHAVSCAECSAKVAEARGFIAGASRILTSLDDTPAVAPKRAAVTASARRARSFWQASPWVTGIAAALILAIGIKEWRDRPSAQSAIASASRQRADSVQAAISAQVAVADSTLRVRQVSAAEPKLASPQPLRPAPEMRRRVADARANSSGAGAGGASSVAADAPRQPAAKAQDVLVNESAPLEKRPSLAEELKASAALIPAAPSPLTAFERAPTKDAKARSDELTLAGCYRVGTLALREDAPAPMVAAAKSVAVVREPSRPVRQMAPSATPAVRAPFELPSIIRLDTTLTSRGRVITSPTTGEALGTWQTVEGDSVRLAIIVAKPRTISTSSRVACPATP